MRIVTLMMPLIPFSHRFDSLVVLNKRKGEENCLRHQRCEKTVKESIISLFFLLHNGLLITFRSIEPSFNLLVRRKSVAIHAYSFRTLYPVLIANNEQ